MKLDAGLAGGWTEEADQLLAENVSSAKKGSSASSVKVSRPLLALPPPPDEEPSSFSSSEEDPAPKRAKKASSSSSSSSSSTRKSALRRRIHELDAEIGELSEAVASHQNIEAKNEELASLRKALAEENEILRGT